MTHAVDIKHNEYLYGLFIVRPVTWDAGPANNLHVGKCFSKLFIIHSSGSMLNYWSDSWTSIIKCDNARHCRQSISDVVSHVSFRWCPVLSDNKTIITVLYHFLDRTTIADTFQFKSSKGNLRLRGWEMEYSCMDCRIQEPKKGTNWAHLLPNMALKILSDSIRCKRKTMFCVWIGQFNVKPCNRGILFRLSATEKNQCSSHSKGPYKRKLK